MGDRRKRVLADRAVLRKSLEPNFKNRKPTMSGDRNLQIIKELCNVIFSLFGSVTDAS